MTMQKRRKVKDAGDNRMNEFLDRSMKEFLFGVINPYPSRTSLLALSRYLRARARRGHGRQ